MTLGLLTSGTTEKNLRSVLRWNSFWDIKHDTTGFIRLLEVDSFKLTIFPPSSGVQFYKDGIVFLSPSKNEGKMLPGHISFGTIEAYYGIPGDSIMEKHMIFSPSSSFSYPCEAITFSPDFNTMYFTKFPKKDNKEKIYMAKYTSTGINQLSWMSEIIPEDFCTDNSIYTHPSLSADEKILVFASDKEGSLGGMDLFITRKEGDKWSSPENLGNLINTPGNEFYPFLDSENNLFFSSDSLSGYGGYDIFTCKFDGEAWDKPINLSPQINSENDDVAFTISKMDGKTAFYTKKQKSGKVEMQLFRVTLREEVADSNLLTISFIFHGKPMLKTSLITAYTVTQVNPVEVEPSMTEPEITVAMETLPEKKSVIEPEPKFKPPESKIETIKPVISVPAESKDIVIYRVQILSGNKPQGNNQIIVNGESYNTYEYRYLGENRYTIGEFSTLSLAVKLQNALRQSGQKQAFVVAFKNNIRSLDPALFK